MKALTTAGLTKLIQLIKSSFISNTDTVTTNTVTLATVATSGSYNDLSNQPTIPTVNDATLTIQKNGVDVQTFTANASTNATANITVPTDTGDLTNNAGFITSSALNGYATQSWVGQQGYITGITSSDVTTALGYTPSDNTLSNVSSIDNSSAVQTALNSKADTDLSNLSSTGKTVIDGQWVVSDTAVGTGLSLNGSTPLEFTLQVPDDGSKYEVLLSVSGTSTSTSGQLCEVNMRSSISNNYIAVCRVIPRTATAVYTSGNIILPLSTDRKLYINRSSTIYGTTNVYLRAYRRIGTNS